MSCLHHAVNTLSSCDSERDRITCTRYWLRAHPTPAYLGPFTQRSQLRFFNTGSMGRILNLGVLFNWAIDSDVLRRLHCRSIKIVLKNTFPAGEKNGIKQVWILWAFRNNS